MSDQEGDRQDQAMCHCSLSSTDFYAMPQPGELCQREMSALTEHPLIPRQKTKRKANLRKEL